MEVKSVVIKEVSNSTIRPEQRKLILEVHNGFNRIKFRITKDNLTYDDLDKITDELEGFDIKGVFYARNCCKNSPIIILDSMKEEDKKEIKDIINKALEIKGNEIKQSLII